MSIAGERVRKALRRYRRASVEAESPVQVEGVRPAVTGDGEALHDFLDHVRALRFLRVGMVEELRAGRKPNRRTRRGVRERRVDGHVVERRKPQRATLPGFPIDTCAAGGMRETRRHEQRRPATSIASVNASLRLTGPPFGAMLRRPHAKLKRASNGQGPAASGHNPPVSTAAYRRWWRARFTEDELWDLAQAVWPNG